MNALLQAAGDFDIVGDDDFEDDEELAAFLAAGDVDIVGAQLAGPGRGGRAIKQLAIRDAVKALRKNMQLQALAKKHQLGLVERPFLGSKRVPAPFDALILANDTATVTITATNPFRPRRFVIPPSVAQQFNIESMSIGMGLQILGNAPVPCECILPDAVGGDWELPTVQTSQQIIMRVTNTTAQDARFRGVCWGEVAVPVGG